MSLLFVGLTDSVKSGQVPWVKPVLSRRQVHNASFEGSSEKVVELPKTKCMSFELETHAPDSNLSLDWTKKILSEIGDVFFFSLVEVIRSELFLNSCEHGNWLEKTVPLLFYIIEGYNLAPRL